MKSEVAMTMSSRLHSPPAQAAARENAADDFNIATLARHDDNTFILPR
jgi:hypothetical protein